MTALKRRLYWYGVLVVIITPLVVMASIVLVMFLFRFHVEPYLNSMASAETLANSFRFFVGLYSVIGVMMVDANVRD